MAAFFLAARILLLAVPATAGDSSPRVVATIQPIHSLVAQVMDGVGVPSLLVRPGASPHAYSLRPSGARAVQEADLVVWVGPDLETFLVRPLDALSRRAKRLTLSTAPGVMRLPARAGGLWTGEDHGEYGGHAHDGAGRWNLHIWLDPANARAILHAVAKALARIDPRHAARYLANASHAAAGLNTLDAKLAERLKPYRRVPYIVFHDAYAYFEHAYGLNAVGAITVDPARQPGAARLTRIRRRIMDAGARCVFTEPEFRPGLVRTLVEGTRARVGILDPIGADVPPGPKAYERILTGLADNLIACLGG
jgi:zinc transport system substrate-binding protein